MAFTAISGRKLYYEKHGDWETPGRVPLLLVMGMAGSCKGWLPLQVPDFAEARPVLLYDHRGVGQSDDPGTPFGTADLADDAAALLASLGIERADVLGAFMGGMAAQELALRHPARVRRLVLVGTWARADAKRRMLLEHWARLARSDAGRETLLYDRLLWTLQDETLEQADLIEAMTDFFTRDAAPVPNALFVRQCQACLEHDTRDRLSAIEARTLVVCGRYDQLTPPKLNREIADLVPDARLVTMANGGHLVMVESARGFNQIVLQFLDDDASR